MVLPDSRMEMGAPVACGRDRSAPGRRRPTARRDRCWCPWGRPGCGRCRPWRPSPRGCRRAWWRRVTGCGLQRIRHLAQHGLEARHQGFVGAGAGGGPAFTTASSASARRRASRAGLSCALPAAARSFCGRGRESWRRSRRRWARGATSNGLMVASSRLLASAISASFSVLLVGHEAGQGEACATSGLARCGRASASAAASDERRHIDGVGRGLRILHQVEQGGNRFHLGAAQIQRIGIELHEGHQPQRRPRPRRPRCAAHACGVPGHEIVQPAPGAAKPTSSSSPGGLSSISSAGSMVMDSRNATIMPMPATFPSSATPV